jgi:hypothetical protein
MVTAGVIKRSRWELPVKNGGESSLGTSINRAFQLAMFGG